MEPLNMMSKLNLSEHMTEPSTVANLDVKTLHDPDYDYHCEYREDIWKNLVEQECEKPTIQLQSPQLEFRGTLVQQLRNVTKQLGMSISTLHSAVAQLDLFMDAHRLRADRLIYVALACLSLAAKSEEKFSSALSLKTLSKISGVPLCGKTFRQLEWMVGDHVRWRLLAPTPVTFAALLSQFVVTNGDLTTRHPKLAWRIKRDGAKILDTYLDLTLSDVRLKVVDSVAVGCACVACARCDLGLNAWPAPLAAAAGREYSAVAPLARRLQRMMQMLKAREGNADTEVDQGYGSAQTSPNLTPCASPIGTVFSATSTISSTTYINAGASYRRLPVYTIPITDRDTSNRLERVIVKVPAPLTKTEPEVDVHPVDMTRHRIDNPTDYRYYKARKILDASFDTAQPSTSMAVKRGLDSNEEFENKRYRYTALV